MAVIGIGTLPRGDSPSVPSGAQHVSSIHPTWSKTQQWKSQALWCLRRACRSLRATRRLETNGRTEPTLPTTGTQLPGSIRPSTLWGPVGEAQESDDDAAVELNLEIEDGETTLFEAAVVAFHSGRFERAESLFLEEAQRTIDSAPQRAAISYRQAALAARRVGNMDASDHWMRLAGREYLRVTEDDRTPLPFIREAAMMAAKCFLSVENLNVASKGLRRAQAIESVLRADDDLMAETNGTQPEPGRHEANLRIERRATVRSDPASRTGAAALIVTDGFSRGLRPRAIRHQMGPPPPPVAAAGSGGSGIPGRRATWPDTGPWDPTPARPRRQLAPSQRTRAAAPGVTSTYCSPQRAPIPT